MKSINLTEQTQTIKYMCTVNIKTQTDSPFSQRRTDVSVPVLQESVVTQRYVRSTFCNVNLDDKIVPLLNCNDSKNRKPNVTIYNVNRLGSFKNDELKCYERF